MKKINWGTGIFLFYTFFATTLFYQVYRSTQYDHSLVVENYYEKDLAYQNTFDKLNNSQSLKNPLQIHYDEILRLVEIEFPAEIKNIKGSVLFYRASDKKEDTLLPIQLATDNCMTIFVRSLKPGLWKIEIDWEGDNTPYLDREMIIVPDYIEDELISEIMD